MANRVLASSVSNVEIAQVAHDVVADRWDNFDLSGFLVYLVDGCAAAALPYLAEQFNVAGLAGFAVATSEEEQRELIKQAILLHKYMGTPYAIRRACETVGFPVIILDEGVPSDPPDPLTDWARFSVFVQTPDTPVDGHVFAKMRAFICNYKPERCHLVGLGLWLPFSENENLWRPKEREELKIEIIGEQMKYYEVIVDDNDEFITDDDDIAVTTTEI